MRDRTRPRRIGEAVVRRRLRPPLDAEPLALLANLFDCGIVFALGFMIAALATQATTPVLRDGERTFPPIDVPDQRASPVARYRLGQDSGTGRGERIGVAYRLPTGEVVCVPER